MKKAERVEQITQQLLDSFEKGEIPEALARVFIHRRIDSPCTAWSFNNQLLIALQGHIDARGFRQWKAVGRKVKKGETASYILGPRMVTLKEDDPERDLQAGDKVCCGFFPIPVFGADQTEGDPLPWQEEEESFLDGLPLIEVARSWGIETTIYSGAPGYKEGFYSFLRNQDPLGETSKKVIGLGVENVDVWAHELIHAADHRLGTLNPRGGQQLDNEIVAQLGASVLLRSIGLEDESDPGGTWKYIKFYANKHDREPLTVCNDLVERVCTCVELVLQTADQLAAATLETESAQQEDARQSAA